MSRQDYIAQEWLGYLAMNGDGSLHPCGRIVELTSSQFTLRNQSQTWTFEFSEIEIIEDPYWGESIQPGFLKIGDVVLAKAQGLFLLAPNLSSSDWSSDEGNRQWVEFLEKVETCFIDRGLDKVTTPFLVSSPGVDQHIDFRPSRRASKCGPR